MADYILKHQYSQQYRTVISDAAFITMVSDGTAPQMTVIFSRMEAKSLFEKATMNDSGAVEVVGGAVPESELVRTIEFAVQMRPDHVKNLANALRKSLAQLPEATRKQFGITTADIGAA